MLTPSIARAARFGAAALLLASAATFAQSPAVNPKEMDSAKLQQQQQVRQPYNNAPVWSEVRSGAPQVSTVTGRESAILIQSGGETWRAARVPLATAGGAIIALAILGLAVFYLFRGEMMLPRSRASAASSALPRSTAGRTGCWRSPGSTLAVTGIILSLGKAVLLPLIGYTLFSWLAISRRTSTTSSGRS